MRSGPTDLVTDRCAACSHFTAIAFTLGVAVAAFPIGFSGRTNPGRLKVRCVAIALQTDKVAPAHATAGIPHFAGRRTCTIHAAGSPGTGYHHVAGFAHFGIGLAGFRTVGSHAGGKANTRALVGAGFADGFGRRAHIHHAIEIFVAISAVTHLSDAFGGLTGGIGAGLGLGAIQTLVTKSAPLTLVAGLALSVQGLTASRTIGLFLRAAESRSTNVAVHAGTARNGHAGDRLFTELPATAVKKIITAAGVQEGQAARRLACVKGPTAGGFVGHPLGTIDFDQVFIKACIAPEAAAEKGGHLGARIPAKTHDGGAIVIVIVIVVVIVAHTVATGGPAHRGAGEQRCACSKNQNVF
jgi:hypothetical protein